MSLKDGWHRLKMNNDAWNVMVEDGRVIYGCRFVDGAPVKTVPCVWNGEMYAENDTLGYYTFLKKAQRGLAMMREVSE